MLTNFEILGRVMRERVCVQPGPLFDEFSIEPLALGNGLCLMADAILATQRRPIRQTARHAPESRPRKRGERNVDRVDHWFAPTTEALFWLKTDRQAALRSDFLVLRHVSTFVTSGM